MICVVVGVRHSKEELAEMQSYPLEMKIALTKDRIRGGTTNIAVMCTVHGQAARIQMF